MLWDHTYFHKENMKMSNTTKTFEMIRDDTAGQTFLIRSDGIDRNPGMVQYLDRAPEKMHIGAIVIVGNTYETTNIDGDLDVDFDVYKVENHNMSRGVELLTLSFLGALDTKDA